MWYNLSWPMCHVLLDSILFDVYLILSGDFNAHLASHSPFKLNEMGKMLMDIQDLRDLISVNDDNPTYSLGGVTAGNVVELFLVSVR